MAAPPSSACRSAEPPPPTGFRPRRVRRLRPVGGALRGRGCSARPAGAAASGGSGGMLICVAREGTPAPLLGPSDASICSAGSSSVFLGVNGQGDKKCNLIIFYAARASTHPNCYLFYCPSTEACPMKAATGLVSYKITTDIHALEDKSIKTENFSSNEYSLPSDAGIFISQSQNIHQNHTASLEQSVFHQASELLNHIGKHLNNMELHTVSPESQRAEESESLDPISRQQKIDEEY
ncbi:MANSC domain-containing protein 1 isoform X3 [Taeniopygia guttata]|uniref:MANSC domain-containing protein 1 isoform X3 n=1 Tax=Taeniopygia guttata TaxID=59729 RepID=UPI003BB85954